MTTSMEYDSAKYWSVIRIYGRINIWKKFNTAYKHKYMQEKSENISPLLHQFTDIW